VETFPHRTQETAWAEVRHLPALSNRICVKHRGNAETQLTNESGPPIHWKAGFPGQPAALLVDGRRKAAGYAILTVGKGQTR
jgi:hypothetical protein